MVLDRKDFFLVETRQAVGCRGCHFRPYDTCPNSRNLRGWVCIGSPDTGYTNMVFVKKNSWRGLVLRTIL